MAIVFPTTDFTAFTSPDTNVEAALMPSSHDDLQRDAVERSGIAASCFLMLIISDIMFGMTSILGTGTSDFVRGYKKAQL